MSTRTRPAADPTGPVPADQRTGARVDGVAAAVFPAPQPGTVRADPWRRLVDEACDGLLLEP